MASRKSRSARRASRTLANMPTTTSTRCRRVRRRLRCSLTTLTTWKRGAQWRSWWRREKYARLASPTSTMYSWPAWSKRAQSNLPCSKSREILASPSQNWQSGAPRMTLSLLDIVRLGRPTCHGVALICRIFWPIQRSSRLLAVWENQRLKV